MTYPYYIKYTRIPVDGIDGGIDIYKVYEDVDSGMITDEIIWASDGDIGAGKHIYDDEEDWVTSWGREDKVSILTEDEVFIECI
jgi:hypothetical protein